MEKISIKEILEITGGELLSGNTDQFIRDVCVDTRKITKESEKVQWKKIIEMPIQK